MENSAMKTQASMLVTLKNRMKESVNRLSEVNSQMERIEDGIYPHDPEKEVSQDAQEPSGLLQEIELLNARLEREVSRYARLQGRLSELL